jgi:threonine dehydrogenase-like Zn-dependent dehydrogenase
MKSTRRTFLGAASLGTAALAVAGPAQAAPSHQIVLGMIGPGGMGTNHQKQLCARKDATVAYVCDVDEKRLAAAAKLVESATGKVPKAVKDLRRVLDDGSVDGVFIATPDHWHAPASILALDASSASPQELQRPRSRLFSASRARRHPPGPGRPATDAWTDGSGSALSATAG